MQLQFREQVAYFAAKRNMLVDDWLDILPQDHDAVFAVPGVRDAAVLQRVRSAMAGAIENGDTLRDFKRGLVDISGSVAYWRGEGFDEWSRRVYETHLRQSYNAARWVQMRRLGKWRPWWRYKQHDSADYPRLQHQQWDGLILHCDDPWWLTHFPANGWGCQCYVEALSDDDLKRLGLTPGKAPPEEYVDAVVGQRSPGGPRLVRTPVGIDPGFGYAPGRYYLQAEQKRNRT